MRDINKSSPGEDLQKFTREISKVLMGMSPKFHLKKLTQGTSLNVQLGTSQKFTWGRHQNVSWGYIQEFTYGRYQNFTSQISHIDITKIPAADMQKSSHEEATKFPKNVNFKFIMRTSPKFHLGQHLQKFSWRTSSKFHLGTSPNVHVGHLSKMFTWVISPKFQLGDALNSSSVKRNKVTTQKVHLERHQNYTLVIPKFHIGTSRNVTVRTPPQVSLEDIIRS